MMQAGSPFPNFSLPNQDGKITKLSDYAGHWLVVYFYPKDDTPGCTIQGERFRRGSPTSMRLTSRLSGSAPMM